MTAEDLKNRFNALIEEYNETNGVTITKFEPEFEILTINMGRKITSVDKINLSIT